MLKNVLIPISSDGLARSDIKKMLGIIGTDAKKITLAFVSDPVPSYIYGVYGDAMTISDEDHRQMAQSFADALFAKVAPKFREIRCETCHIFNTNVADGIFEAAKKTKAELIAMSSHKRKGLNEIFFGSDAHKVIVSSKLPVLVV
jgi:nucleotide-binding universal stress UspA family protein